MNNFDKKIKSIIFWTIQYISSAKNSHFIWNSIWNFLHIIYNLISHMKVKKGRHAQNKERIKVPEKARISVMRRRCPNYPDYTGRYTFYQTMALTKLSPPFLYILYITRFYNADVCAYFSYSHSSWGPFVIAIMAHDREMSFSRDTVPV